MNYFSFFYKLTSKLLSQILKNFYHASYVNNVCDVSNDEKHCEKQYDWSNADYGAIAQYLASVDWYKMLNVNLEVDSTWYAFCDILNTTIDNCMPWKNIPLEAKLTKLKIRYPPGIQRPMAHKRCVWCQHKKGQTYSQAVITYCTNSNR